MTHRATSVGKPQIVNHWISSWDSVSDTHRTIGGTGEDGGARFCAAEVGRGTRTAFGGSPDEASHVEFWSALASVCDASDRALSTEEAEAFCADGRCDEDTFRTFQGKGMCTVAAWLCLV